MSSAFDDIIRGKLAGASFEGTPDFDALAEQMDGEAFDARLREALPAAGISAAALSTPALPDWEGLLNRLDADADADGDAFDRLISRRLAEVESDLAPADSWRQLSHRIDTLWPLRRVLIRYRALEIAAAAALILTFVPMLRDNPIWRDDDTQIVDSAAAGVRADASSAAEGQADADASASTYSPLDNLAQALGFGSSRGTVASPEEIAAIYSPLTAAAGGGSSRTGTAALDARQLPSVVSTAPGTMAVSVASAFAPTASTVGHTPNALPALDLAPFAVVQPRLVLGATAVGAKPWSFGASGTYKAWQIFTPTDQSFDRLSTRRGIVAPQIGAHVLRSLGSRWRLGLSVGVTSATYSAGLPEVLRSTQDRPAGFDLSEDFRSIDLDIAQAALELRYSLTSAERPVRLWVKGGVGSNLFLRTGYDVRLRFGEQSSAAAPVGGVETEVIFSKQAAKSIEKPVIPSQVKQFASGLLEGGKVSETTQSFGRLGLEAELKLGDRLRAFGSVDGDLVLPGQRGFGPNGDRFGAVGIELGARVSL